MNACCQRAIVGLFGVLKINDPQRKNIRIFNCIIHVIYPTKNGISDKECQRRAYFYHNAHQPWLFRSKHAYKSKIIPTVALFISICPGHLKTARNRRVTVELNKRGALYRRQKPMRTRANKRKTHAARQIGSKRERGPKVDFSTTRNGFSALNHIVALRARESAYPSAARRALHASYCAPAAKRALPRAGIETHL